MMTTVMKFEGEKPELDDYIEVTGDETVRKWPRSDDMSKVVGIRILELKSEPLEDNEILVRLIGGIPGDGLVE